MRVFDDRAFCPWDAPRTVKKKDIKAFGGGRSSRSWCKRRVESLKNSMTTQSEFDHVFTKGALEALRLATAHDAEKGVSRAKVDRRDRRSGDGDTEWRTAGVLVRVANGCFTATSQLLSRLSQITTRVRRTHVVQTFPKNSREER